MSFENANGALDKESVIEEKKENLTEETELAEQSLDLRQAAQMQPQQVPTEKVEKLRPPKTYEDFFGLKKDEKKEKIETFQVNIAGQEFTLPTVMEVGWPRLGEMEVFNIRFGDIEVDEFNIREEISKKEKELNDLVSSGQDFSLIEKQQESLISELKELKDELAEVLNDKERFLQQWEKMKSYYSVDMDKLNSLIEEKKQELKVFYRHYDMATDEERTSMELEKDNIERGLINLQNEYSRYLSLDKDFSGKAKARNVYLDGDVLSKYPKIWNKKVDKPGKVDALDLSTIKDTGVKYYEIDMPSYVEQNRDAIELIAKSSGNFEDGDLAMQKDWFSRPVVISLNMGGKKYSFDLAAYQRKRYKVYKKIQKANNELAKLRKKRDNFLEKDQKVQLLKANLQEKFQAWVNLKRENNKKKKEGEIFLKAKLNEARENKDKDAYYGWLDLWEEVQLKNENEVNLLDQAAFDAQKKYQEYIGEINKKMSIHQKEKNVERLYKEYTNANTNVTNNPAWLYMDLFTTAVEKAKDVHKK